MKIIFSYTETAIKHRPSLELWFHGPLCILRKRKAHILDTIDEMGFKIQIMTKRTSASHKALSEERVPSNSCLSIIFKGMTSLKRDDGRK